MRQLRFVASGADVDHVVLETADGGEQFTLRIDPVLRDAIRADLPRLHHDEPPEQPKITPREIQIRVRGGATPESVAEETGAALGWVQRFAGPVLDERGRLADEARRARARRSTTEGQTVVFGEAVDARFAAHGIDPAHVRWDARRRDDGQWLVTAHWVGGDAERTAEWTFHLGSRTVAPVDDTAADLLSDRPIPPLAVATVETVTSVSLSLAPPLRPGVVAFPAMPDAHTGPLPIPEEVFDQDALDSAEGADHVEGVVPALPLHAVEQDDLAHDDFDDDVDHGMDLFEHVTAPLPSMEHLVSAHVEPAETEEQKAARAHIPSWDDILLGVRRKSD